MDRRQRKTREAIFSAFAQLLSEKSLSKITVSDIIERADIGRATFYSHFETKDFLLKELCEELFCHIFDSMGENSTDHRHIFECDAPQSAFLHLVEHIQKNDNHILDLLSCQNNELFLSYFKTGLLELIKKEYKTFENSRTSSLPKDFWINHIASTFVETIRWWIDNKMQQSAEKLTEYFMIAINA